MASADRLRTVLTDRYVIERELGAGGMARDVRHNRHVALKVLHQDPGVPLGSRLALT
jgi:hypothetical protein